MDYNDLALFVRTVEAKSFAAAALAAGVQRSSVTRCIARLESELGVRLFQRTSHHRVITDAGRALHERIRASFADLDAATDAIRDLGGEPNGVVRITMPPGLSMGGVPEVIALFARTYSRIRVEVSVARQRLDLVREGIDIALRAGDLEDSSLVARRLGSARCGLLASPSYLKERGTPVKPADLLDHDCVSFRGADRPHLWTLIGPAKTEAISISGTVTVDDLAFMLSMVKSGSGICWAPLFLVARDLESGALQRVLPDHHLHGPTFHLVMPSASLVPARVALLRDFLVQHFAPTLDTEPSAQHRVAAVAATRPA